jgi:hypothetical protein
MYILIFIDVCTSIYFRLIFSKMVIEIKKINTSIESYEKKDNNDDNCNIDNNAKPRKIEHETGYMKDYLHEKHNLKISELKCLLRDLLQIVATLGIHTYVYIYKYMCKSLHVYVNM